MKLAIKVAWAFMRRRNSFWPSFSAWASILGVSFGVAGFLVVVTIVNSIQKQFKEILLSANPHLAVYTVSRRGIPNAMAEAKRLREKITFPVTSYALFEYSEGIINNGVRTATVVIRGVDIKNSVNALEFQHLVEPKNAFLNLGAPLSLNTNKAETSNTAENTNTPEPSLEKIFPVVLGKGLALRLQAGVGDSLNLTVGDYDGKQRNVRLQILGLINVGLSGYDDRLAILEFNNAVEILGQKGWARGIEFGFKNLDDALPASEELKEYTPYIVRPWQNIDRNLLSQIERDGNSIRIIVGIITLVAAFNILTTLSLNVIDRTKQIALLRSIGATKALVLKTFVAMGMIFGCVGSLLGVGFGLAILRFFQGLDLGDLKTTYFLEKVPVFYDWKLVAQSILVALLLSFLSSLYPAWKAIRIAPLSGMQQGMM